MHKFGYFALLAVFLTVIAAESEEQAILQRIADKIAAESGKSCSPPDYDGCGNNAVCSATCEACSTLAIETDSAGSLNSLFVAFTLVTRCH